MPCPPLELKDVFHHAEKLDVLDGLVEFFVNLPLQSLAAWLSKLNSTTERSVKNLVFQLVLPASGKNSSIAMEQPQRENSRFW